MGSRRAARLIYGLYSGKGKCDARGCAIPRRGAVEWRAAAELLALEDEEIDGIGGKRDGQFQAAAGFGFLLDQLQVLGLADAVAPEGIGLVTPGQVIDGQIVAGIVAIDDAGAGGKIGSAFAFESEFPARVRDAV